MLIIPHGEITARVTNGITELSTPHSVTGAGFNLHTQSHRRHRADICGTYNIPFKLEMRVMIDFPAFILLVGDGHITFATPREDNRKIEDFIKPSGKPNQDRYSYDNRLPFNEWVDISVAVNPDELQIIINGEERYYSRKQSYVKAKIHPALTLGLVVAKGALLRVQSFSVVESKEAPPVERGGFEEKKPVPLNIKPTFENVIAHLPPVFQKEALAMDNYLKSLNPLKFKRAVDKNGGKITYTASNFGISYTLRISGAESSHDFGWYIVTNGKPETWHRKADYMEETLAEIAETNGALAERIFNAISDCVGCYAPGCLAKVLYNYNGRKRFVCHGRIRMRLCRADFDDTREFFGYLNEMLKYKTESGYIVD
jgi:hypothetical protein